MKKELPKTKVLHKVDQFTTFETSFDYEDSGKLDHTIKAKVSYGDKCNNGHNTFHITGDIKDSLGDYVAGGCVHEEISKVFPDLAPFIKWHGTSSDSPLYYIENTVYCARDRTHEGVKIGDPVSFDKRLKFEGIPFTFKEQEKGFWEFLNNSDVKKLEIEEVKYDGEDKYDFGPKFSLAGFINPDMKRRWYSAPFSSNREAEEFLDALKNHKFGYIEIPTKWCEAVEPNINAARLSAIWEDATLEQLQSKEALRERLTALMWEFKEAVESFGFDF